jgi:hypothetical protein
VSCARQAVVAEEMATSVWVSREWWCLRSGVAGATHPKERRHWSPAIFRGGDNFGSFGTGQGEAYLDVLVSESIRLLKTVSSAEVPELGYSSGAYTGAGVKKKRGRRERGKEKKMRRNEICN